VVFLGKLSLQEVVCTGTGGVSLVGDSLVGDSLIGGNGLKGAGVGCCPSVRSSDLGSKVGAEGDWKYSLVEDIGGLGGLRAGD
jgi:hypothetical protein